MKYLGVLFMKQNLINTDFDMIELFGSTVGLKLSLIHRNLKDGKSVDYLKKMLVDTELVKPKGFTTLLKRYERISKSIHPNFV